MTATGPAPIVEEPQDALMIRKLLSSMGVEDYEPRVVHQLLDFMYAHVSGVLQDAEAYSERAGATRGQVEVEDAMIAIQARAAFSFVQPPPQHVLAGMAAKRNARPLPPVGKVHGLRLPPEGQRLTSPHWDLMRPQADGPPSGAPAATSAPEPPSAGSHGPFYQELESPVGEMGSRPPLEQPEPWPVDPGEGHTDIGDPDG